MNMANDTDTSDSDSDHAGRNSLSTKTKQQKHRAQKFRLKWQQHPDYKFWLEPDPEDPFKAGCRLCKIGFTAELSVIKKHKGTARHVKNAKVVKTNRNIFHTFLGTNKTTKEEDIVKKTEIEICGFLSEHNIPFRVIDHLEAALKNWFPDSEICKKINLKRTKVTNVIKNVIAKAEKNEIAKVISKVKFSIMTDESTDISTAKSSCIIVRYFDEKTLKVRSDFWELCQVFKEDDSIPTASAERLYQNIIKSFQIMNIPLTNIIGFGADGCNTMFGEHNSVSSRFRESCPGIITMKCICHSLHLCASNACKVLPRNLEDFAREVYSFFKYSAKRKSEFIQFQIFADTNVHNILHPSQTRWLSCSAVVERILEQWEPLKLYFTEKWVSERLLSAEFLFKSLHDPFLKMYYNFMNWILPKFSRLNAYFQSEKVLISEIYNVMVTNFTDILLLYMDRAYIMNTPLHKINPRQGDKILNYKCIYLGVHVMNDLKKEEIKNKPDLLNDFYGKVVGFLTTACAEIKKRFDFNDPILPKIACLMPKKASSQKERETTPTLMPLMELLKRIASDDLENWQKIDDEWRELCNYKLQEHLADLEPDEFWGNISQIRSPLGEHLFRNLSMFALGILSLPHSNAECERTFSKINLIKTKVRNRLCNKTINGAVLASQVVKKVGNCTNFQATADMIRLMTKDNLYQKSDSKENNNNEIIEIEDGIIFE